MGLLLLRLPLRVQRLVFGRSGRVFGLGTLLPPSTASTSAGGGSSAASERDSRGSPAASFSMGMTMATPVIAFGSLQRPGPARQIVRTVEVGETFKHGGNDPPLQQERGGLKMPPQLRQCKAPILRDKPE